jgi:hypothetical protein
MSRVRLPLALVVTSLGFGCAHETFDLLPPPDSMSTGGAATGGFSGTGGDAGAATGGLGGTGRGGVGGGPTPPGANCPPGVFPCEFCRTPMDCEIGTFCDTFRSYCAPFCNSQDDCAATLQTPICDENRAVCVECFVASHCTDRELTCVRGECVERECFTNDFCGDEVCDPNGGFCRNCFNDFECGPGLACFMGSCVPDGP